MYPNIVRTIACIFQILTFAVGMIGNVLVCSAVHNKASMHTPTNFILINLAVADILGCVVNMPLMFVTFITDFQHNYIEIIGEIHFVLTVFIGIAVCSCHILLCIDRHDAIKSPFRRRITKLRMGSISRVLWSVSIGAAVLTSVLVILIPTHWLTLQDDQPHFIAGEILNGFGVVVIVSILVAMLYSCCVVKQGIVTHNNQMVQSLGRATLDREMRINRVATLLVMCFTITCLPWIVVRLIYSITGHQDKISYIISYTFLYTSHALMPIVYAGFIKPFQKAMLHILYSLISKIICGKHFCCNEVVPEETTDVIHPRPSVINHTRNTYP